MFRDTFKIFRQCINNLKKIFTDNLIITTMVFKGMLHISDYQMQKNWFLKYIFFYNKEKIKHLHIVKKQNYYLPNDIILDF